MCFHEFYFKKLCLYSLGNRIAISIFYYALILFEHQCNSSFLVSLGESLLFVVNETIRGMLSIALLQVWQNFSVDLPGSGFSFLGRLFFIIFQYCFLLQIYLSLDSLHLLLVDYMHLESMYSRFFQFMRIYISIELLTDNLVSIGMCCNLPFLISNFINLSLLFLPFGQFGQVFVNLLIFSKNQFIV